MDNQLITFEAAILAKEKGFDGLCYDAYNSKGMLNSNGWCEYIDDADTEFPISSKNLKDLDMLAPTQSHLQKWLREKHDIFVRVYFSAFSSERIFYGFEYNFTWCANEEWTKDEGIYDTYEEALEAGLINALKLI